MIFIFSSASLRLKTLKAFVASIRWTASFLRHKLEAVFQVMRIVVNYLKGHKQLKKVFYNHRVP